MANSRKNTIAGLIAEGWECRGKIAKYHVYTHANDPGCRMLIGRSGAFRIALDGVPISKSVSLTNFPSHKRFQSVGAASLAKAAVKP